MSFLHDETVLITGCAGFIGFHITLEILQQGGCVIGIDNLNSYYDVNLKNSRLNILLNHKNFIFKRIDLVDYPAVMNLAVEYPEINYIIHLAAQAGVRYSLVNPVAYLSNFSGQLSVLELARNLKNFKHLVYASSSSVYGTNTKLPFSIADRVDTPMSLYAATKKSCELMSYSYNHLFGITITGLRYFTAYGPWGRPDMSAFIFTKAILAGEQLSVYNNGDMWRNFTYVRDIVTGTINCLLKFNTNNNPGCRIYNLGNNRSENLMDFIAFLEELLQKKANICFQPMQPGDVKDTVADISASSNDFGFEPKTNIQDGLQEFVIWYKDYHQIR